MTHTFSKIYGLPALRIGWGYACAGIIDILNRIRPPVNINTPAQNAGIAALEDAEFTKRSIEHNTKWRDILTQSINGMGWEVVPSQANFILVNFGSNANSAKAFNFLAQKGILVREVNNYNLPEFLRISFGTDEENEYLLKCLQEFKSSLA
jgi:histidinol-phosphate aminotransferase